ncbi:MAG: triple tyrosine motif-containing protein, partial [Haliea sp.]
LHQFQNITFESARLDRSDQPTIWSMAETQDHIWFGSLHHGLFKLDKDVRIRELSTVDLEHVEISSPFSGKTVYAIEAGSQGEVWFSTNRGISRLAKDGGLLNFGHTHGLQETEFELGSSYKDLNGFIYFGGNHGYNRFDPNDVIATGKPSRIALNSITLDGEDVIPLPPISAFDSILLNHTDRFITFEFSALDFTDPESTRYRHKLVGFDKDWVDVGNRGSATYTNLPAGDYIFRVQAVNSAGIWNYDGLTIALRVAPAPWLTWWAFSAYFVLFLGIASLFLKFYRNYMLKEQQLKQANEMQRVADRFADELQDQIDFQSKLTDSIHSYNKQLLYWARFCTDTTLEYEPGATELAHKRVRFRLEVLDVVQDSLYYQGERLYANLHDCAARLASALCSSHPQVCNRLAVVNNVQQELVPAAQAIPVAIILAELFDNSLTHGFDAERSSCFVRFSVTFTANPGANSDTVSFIYQDNGIGIPPGLAFESPESAGFAIIKRAGEELGCELAIGREDRSMVTASFHLPWS